MGTRGKATANTPNGPVEEVVFSDTIHYNAFDDMTSRSTHLWSEDKVYTRNFLNHRDQNASFTYDSAGNATHDTEGNHTFDASGEQTAATYLFGAFNNQTYDGDGLIVKRLGTVGSGEVTTYFVKL